MVCQPIIITAFRLGPILDIIEFCDYIVIFHNIAYQPAVKASSNFYFEMEIHAWQQRHCMSIKTKWE